MVCFTICLLLGFLFEIFNLMNACCFVCLGCFFSLLFVKYIEFIV
ncbi:hypothetical protein M23134_03260 [Microscilla marina ATCC 23134]|uniref:Uncharacterized protein n=1 Tax=Microscilla marina ATCC 23134 TaxID=313606 RepID=A1ZGK5_MICM2|nr:hypothetical protein M23134_03260 [Microscilla marina ATCC 23134]